MIFINKIKKFASSTNTDRKKYLLRYFKKAYFYFLPLVTIIKLPFVSYKERRNLLMDFIERITNSGPVIRYRYYLTYKMFYSCLNEVGTGIVNNTMSNRIYEKDTCDFLEKSVKTIDNPIFIDVGANIGLISLYMLKKIPNIKIYSFEPSPHQCSLFKRTIEENNIANKVELYDLALSNKEGVVNFFAHETGCPADGLKDTGRGGEGKNIQVNATKLDTWWKEKGKPKINLIKIDTEGAELLVLEGAIELLKECRPDIFFEMQEINYKVYGYSYFDVLNFFKNIQFSVYTESGEVLNIENTKKLMANNYNFIAKWN